MIDKTCAACGLQIQGRQDKIFCSSYCRTYYHNQRNKEATRLIRHVNGILRKNRFILVEFLGGYDKPALVKKDRLLVKGFRFEFYTGQFRNDNNEIYYYCYDFGYRLLDAEKVMVVKSKASVWLSKKRKLPRQ